MELVTHALRGAASAAHVPLARLQRALVVGAGGTLGAALVGEALVPGRFQTVGAIVAAPVASAVRGFDAVPEAALRAGALRGAEIAFVVFERERHSNGRDEAFLQPAPEDLPALARALHAGGVRRLVVVVPHAPALLPQALQAGFATRTEGEVAALGFEHLVFLRPAQYAVAPRAASGVRRFADWWLAQLRLMVPLREQPVLAARLAAVVVALGRLLPLAAPGTRVVPPDTLWQAAQGDAEAVLSVWLGVGR